MLWLLLGAGLGVEEDGEQFHGWILPPSAAVQRGGHNCHRGLFCLKHSSGNMGKRVFCFIG